MRGLSNEPSDLGRCGMMRNALMGDEEEVKDDDESK